MKLLLTASLFAGLTLAQIQPTGKIGDVTYRLEPVSRQSVRLELSCPDKNVEAYKVLVVFVGDNDIERRYTVERKDGNDARSFVELRLPSRDQAQIKSLKIQKLK